MVPTDHPQSHILDNDADWPRFDGVRLLKAGAAGAAGVGSYLAIVEFLFPSLSEDGPSERRWQIVGFLALMAVAYAVWPWILIAKRRIQRYGPVKAKAKTQQIEIERLLSIVESSTSQTIQDYTLITELQAETDRLRQGVVQLLENVDQAHIKNRSLVDLIRSFQMVLSLLDRVEVVRAVAIEDEVFLAVEPSDDVQLSSGDEIVVFDRVTGEPLGIFLCSHRSSGSAWFAKEAQIFARLWWGFMRTTAESRAVPSIQILGLVYRRKEHHDG